jgi:hypothetical protein
MVNMTVGMEIHVLVMGNRYGVQKECQEEWFGEIFQVNMKVGLKNE